MKKSFYMEKSFLFIVVYLIYFQIRLWNKYFVIIEYSNCDLYLSNFIKNRLGFDVLLIEVRVVGMW